MSRNRVYDEVKEGEEGEGEGRESDMSSTVTVNLFDNRIDFNDDWTTEGNNSPSEETKDTNTVELPRSTLRNNGTIVIENTNDFFEQNNTTNATNLNQNNSPNTRIGINKL